MGGNTAAVILAAGSGKRMGTDTPKQFLLLKDRPVLYWTLKAFEESDCEQMVLVVSDEEAGNYCQKEIIDRYGITKVAAIVKGGAERYDSVWEGLQWLHDEGRMSGGDAYVCIHDGARCLITPDVIHATLRDAGKHKAAVAAVPVKDTIKQAGADGFAERTLDRSVLWQMQTPQTFLFSLIFEAYASLMREGKTGGVTDDAQVLERMTGRKTYLSESSYENFKITTPEDMILAGAVLGGREVAK